MMTSVELREVFLNRRPEFPDTRRGAEIEAARKAVREASKSLDAAYRRLNDALLGGGKQ